MLQELINAISGPAMTAGFKYSSAVDAGVNIPPRAAFGQFLSTLLSSFTNGSAKNSFQNQNGISQKNLRLNALAPGSVLINSANVPAQAQMQQQYPGYSIPGQFPGIGFSGGSPLQGFAGQGFPGAVGAQGLTGGVSGIGGAGGIGGVGGVGFPVGGIGGVGFNPSFPNQQGGLGKLMFLIGPIASVFSLLGSLFNLRKLIGSLRPVKIDTSNTNFNGSQDYIASKYQEGSFDEPAPYEENNSGGEFNMQGLSEF